MRFADGTWQIHDRAHASVDPELLHLVEDVVKP